MCCNNVPKRILPMWGFGNLLAYNRGKVVHLLWTLQGEKVYNLTQLRRNHKKHAKNRPCDDEISDIQTLPVSRNVTLCSQASSCCKQFWKKLRQKRLDTPKMKHLYHCIESGKLTPFSKRRAMNPPRRKSTWVSTKKWRTLKLKTMLNNVLC